MFTFGLVIAILCQVAMAGVILLKVLKKRNLFDIAMMGGLGAIALGSLLLLVSPKTMVAGGVLYLIGWPAIAVGFIVPRFAAARQQLAELAATPAQAPAPQAPAQQAPAQAEAPAAEAPAEQAAPAEEKPAEEESKES